MLQSPEDLSLQPVSSLYPIPKQLHTHYGWERPSIALKVFSAEAEEFLKMKTYLTGEITELEDTSMNRELEVLEKILQSAPK